MNGVAQALGLSLLGVCGLLSSAATASDAAAGQADSSWPTMVPGFVPPTPGEHPRLLFRKSDLPALKKKAETPDGKAIIAHLKVTLGGGEAMPTVFSTEPPVNTGGKSVEYPAGAFTISHAAGFGMLYQLTGEKKYADLAKAAGYPPGSNHFGSYILAPGMIALAFKGDPGADDKRLDAVLATTEESLKRQLGGGFGDHGWFAEGTACGRISSNGILPLMESLKVAAGKDYISPRPAGRYTVLRLMHEIVRVGDHPEVPSRGDYGNDVIWPGKRSLSFRGDFPVGMGAVLPDEARAMAWIYDHFGEPGEKVNWDSPYPHQAIYALVNWPEKTLEPEKVLPKVMVDDIHGYYVCRNRWQDGDDTVVTTLLKRGPGGYKSGKVRTGTIVWAYGMKLDFGGLGGKTTHFGGGKEGSMELSDEKGGSLVVDFGGSSGAPVLLAAVGKISVRGGAPKGKPNPSSVNVVNVNGTDITVLTFSQGEHPLPKVTGAEIAVGQQTIKVADGKLSLRQFSEAMK